MTVVRAHNSGREDPPHLMADDFKEAVIEPLQSIRDHCHWLSVVRRRKDAEVLEEMAKAMLRMAYWIQGRIVRGEN